MSQVKTMEEAVAALRRDVDRQQAYMQDTLVKQLQSTQELINSLISRADKIEVVVEASVVETEKRRSAIENSTVKVLEAIAANNGGKAEGAEESGPSSKAGGSKNAKSMLLAKQMVPEVMKEKQPVQRKVLWKSKFYQK